MADDRGHLTAGYFLFCEANIFLKTQYLINIWCRIVN